MSSTSPQKADSNVPLDSHIKLMTNLKTNVAEIVKNQQEALALLKLLALGSKEIQAGKFSDAHVFLDEMDD